MPNLFDFVDVVVRYDSTVVLNGVTTSIPDGGQITCLLGPSGSGKSTLLRLCNRLEAVTSGSVRFRGQDVSDVDVLRHRRRVGMVFQRPTLFAGTVRENLLVADPDATDDEMRIALERAQLPIALLDRDGDALSGGEAQRACLARTLITGPEVLLMDEPTSSLDPPATAELEKLGRSLADDDIPVVWVTHDVSQAGRIADEQIVIAEGRLATEHEIDHFMAGEDANHNHGEDAGG